MLAIAKKRVNWESLQRNTSLGEGFALTVEEKNAMEFSFNSKKNARNA